MNKSIHLILVVFLLTTESAFGWRPLGGDWSIPTPRPPKVENPLKKYDYCVVLEYRSSAGNTQRDCYECSTRGIGGDAGKAYCAKQTAMSGEGGHVLYGQCCSERNYNTCEGRCSSRNIYQRGMQQ